MDNIILVVEDDKFLQSLLVQKLEMEGFKNVKTVSNGKEVFGAVQSLLPSLIVLDMVLPDIDGFEILSVLKSKSETKNIPVLVLSNLGEKEDIDRCMKLGAVDYMVKAHFTPAEIVDRIKEILKQ